MLEAVFYIIGEASPYTGDGADMLIAKLCRKQAKSGTAVVLCADTASASHYDDVLWTFDATSFVPHGVDDAHAKVMVTTDAARTHVGAAQTSVVINTTNEAVLHALGALGTQGRVVELIHPDAASKAAGRVRYKAYASAGFKMTTHEV